VISQNWEATTAKRMTVLSSTKW